MVASAAARTRSARVSALFLLAQQQEVDRERDARSESQKGVDARAILQLGSL